MSLASIILLILIGLFLLILEILFVPGMVLGFISVILMLVGVIFAFKDYGTTAGFIVLGATSVASAAAVYWAFHSGLWKLLQVQSSIDGKANLLETDIKTGDAGKTISRLNPIGKAVINKHHVEVQAVEGFIDEQKEVTVVKIQHNKVFVKLKS